MFGEPTDSLILRARQDQTLGHKLDRKQKLLLVLQDGRWHNLYEEAHGRFGARKWDLEQLGVRFEMKLDPDRPKDEMWTLYRLSNTDGQDSLL